LKVLLLGEYSGLHNCLKDGLNKLGINAKIASDGDSWKNFPSDFDFVHPLSATSLMGRVFKNLKPFFFLPEIKNFDLVQFINPMILSPRFGINSIFVEAVIQKAKKTILLAAGDDARYYDSLDLLRYNPIDDYKKIDLNGSVTPWDNENLILSNKLIAEKAHKIIPMAYEYWLGYSNYKNCSHTIPMPINIEKYSYKKNMISGKIKFIHGLNRPGFKGSRFIMEAFEKMNKIFSKNAEFVIADRVSINEYTKLIDNANVVVDQALSYSFGMNALISMAKGKVVMSGSEPEILPIYSTNECPVINILPDVNDICQKIEYIICNKDTIKQLGLQSREFVTKHHSHIIIAEKFIEAWT